VAKDLIDDRVAAELGTLTTGDTDDQKTAKLTTGVLFRLYYDANAAKSGNPIAVATFSAHSLGLAVDIATSAGSEHFLEMTTHPMSNVFGMRAAQAHKRMLLRVEEFGWYPYGNEPWHWEYNPPGFRDRFRAIVDPPKATAKPAAAVTHESH
jgi:hypothetical protein